MYAYAPLSIAVSTSCKKRGIFLGDIANRAWFRTVLFDELESAMLVLRWGGLSVSALSFSFLCATLLGCVLVMGAVCGFAVPDVCR